jgi:hypothetical protein
LGIWNLGGGGGVARSVWPKRKKGLADEIQLLFFAKTRKIVFGNFFQKIKQNYRVIINNEGNENLEDLKMVLITTATWIFCPPPRPLRASRAPP